MVGSGKKNAESTTTTKKDEPKKAPGRPVDPSKFETYFDFRNAIDYVKPHQTLAINRGESLKVLTVKVEIPSALRQELYRFACVEYLSEGVQSPERHRLFDAAFEEAYTKKRTLCFLSMYFFTFYIPFFSLFSSTPYMPASAHCTRQGGRGVCHRGVRYQSQAAATHVARQRPTHPRHRSGFHERLQSRTDLRVHRRPRHGRHLSTHAQGSRALVWREDRQAYAASRVSVNTKGECA